MERQGSAGNAIATFRKRGGILRTKETLALGIHPRTLYRLRDDCVLDVVSRGVYRLAAMPRLAHPGLATVAVQGTQILRSAPEWTMLHRRTEAGGTVPRCAMTF